MNGENGFLPEDRKAGISMDKVITIGRQYGSGGRIVGQRLAEELGILFMIMN